MVFPYLPTHLPLISYPKMMQTKHISDYCLDTAGANVWPSKMSGSFSQNLITPLKHQNVQCGTMNMDASPKPLEIPVPLSTNNQSPPENFMSFLFWVLFYEIIAKSCIKPSLGLHNGNVNSPCLLILLIHTKNKNNNIKS